MKYRLFILKDVQINIIQTIIAVMEQDDLIGYGIEDYENKNYTLSVENEVWL